MSEAHEEHEQPKPRGRRTKLTPEVHAEIVECIADGGTDKDAYELAGIGETTFYRWLDRGERAKKPTIFRAFWEDVKKAEIGFKAKHRKNVENAALYPSETVTTTVRQTSTGEFITETKTEKKPPSWQASMTLLERKFPEEYGRTVIQHEGEIDTGDEATEVHLHFVPTGDKGAAEKEEPAEPTDAPPTEV